MTTMKKPILAVVAVVGIVVAVGAYNLYRGARIKAKQPCWAKLRNIETAKEVWALDVGATSGAPVTIESILPYLSMSLMPTCHVAGGKYIVGKVGEEPSCTVHGTASHFIPDRY
jgi:hypothetical protein